MRPIFKAVGLRFTIVSTEYAGHATKIAAECDLSTSDAIAIVGGDGMVQEVVTGLCSRGDDTCTPLCLVPGGSANAFAHMYVAVAMWHFKTKNARRLLYRLSLCQ